MRAVVTAAANTTEVKGKFIKVTDMIQGMVMVTMGENIWLVLHYLKKKKSFP